MVMCEDGCVGGGEAVPGGLGGAAEGEGGGGKGDAAEGPKPAGEAGEDGPLAAVEGGIMEARRVGEVGGCWVGGEGGEAMAGGTQLHGGEAAVLNVGVDVGGRDGGG